MQRELWFSQLMLSHLKKNVFIESQKEIKKMITNYLGKDSLINCQH